MKLTHSPVYNPKSNPVERSHRDLGPGIKTLCQEEGPEEWEKYLPRVLFALRTNLCKTTGLAPYQLLFGRDPSQPLDHIFGAPPTASNGNESHHVYARKFRERMDQVQTTARGNIGDAVRRQSRMYHGERKQFVTGTKVWLFTPTPQKGRGKKLSTYWSGPWTIQESVGTLLYKITPHESWKGRVRRQTVGIDRLKIYNPPIRPGYPELVVAPPTDADLPQAGNEFMQLIPICENEEELERAPEKRWGRKESESDSDDDDSDMNAGGGGAIQVAPAPQAPEGVPPAAPPPGPAPWAPAAPPPAQPPAPAPAARPGHQEVILNPHTPENRRHLPNVTFPGSPEVPGSPEGGGAYQSPPALPARRHVAPPPAPPRATGGGTRKSTRARTQTVHYGDNVMMDDASFDRALEAHEEEDDAFRSVIDDSFRSVADESSASNPSPTTPRTTSTPVTPGSASAKKRPPPPASARPLAGRGKTSPSTPRAGTSMTDRPPWGQQRRAPPPRPPRAATSPALTPALRRVLRDASRSQDQMDVARHLDFAQDDDDDDTL